MPLNVCIEHDNVAEFDPKSIWFSGFVSKKYYHIRQNKGKAVKNTKDLFLFTDQRQLSFITYHTKFILFKFNFYNS